MIMASTKLLSRKGNDTLQKNPIYLEKIFSNGTFDEGLISTECKHILIQK